jgi:osmoprotectant transport system substrate-binding protein
MRRTTRSAHSARRAGLIGLLTLAVTLAGCGQEGSSGGGGGGSTPSGGANTVASQLVLGAGPECPDRPYCLPGLMGTYGLTFKEFRPFDESGGSQTKSALGGGVIDIGLVFTSDGEIGTNNWVLLEDDKKLQPSDNVTPVVNNAIVEAYGDDLAKVVNTVSASITTSDLIAMNKAVVADKQDSAKVAEDFLQTKKLLPDPALPARSGPPIVVGSANFSENETLANIYLLALRGNGYTAEPKLKIGSREIYFPALKSGEVSLIPEYAGTLTRFVDPNQPSTTDPAQTAEALEGVLASQGVTAYEYSPAQDQNGFAVTRATADRYRLKTLSDLGKPAS